MRQILRKIFLSTILLVVTACGSAPVVEKPVVQPIKPVIVEVKEPVFVAEPGLSNQQRLRKSIHLLELGDPGQAQAELEAYLSDIPKSKIASGLLRQITEPIDQLFPQEFVEVSLGQGETISTLAKQYLGDPLQFFALARYNNLSEPGKLSAGQQLRIPLTKSAKEFIASAALVAPSTENVSVAADPGVLGKGQLPLPLPKDEMVIAAEQDVSAEPPLKEQEVLLPSEEQLLDAAMLHVEEELVLSGVELLSVLLADNEEEELFLAFDNYGTTDNLDNEMLNGIARAYIKSADKIRVTDSALAAARYLRAGELLLSVDNKQRAQEVMQNSVDLDPTNTAAVEQHGSLSRELVDQYHNDASHAFRRQELDIAIDLWQRALAIDPFHTPSLNNLVQAEELKQKLDQVR